MAKSKTAAKPDPQSEPAAPAESKPESKAEKKIEPTLMFNDRGGVYAFSRTYATGQNEGGGLKRTAVLQRFLWPGLNLVDDLDEMRDETGELPATLHRRMKERQIRIIKGGLKSLDRDSAIELVADTSHEETLVGLLETETREDVVLAIREQIQGNRSDKGSVLRKKLRSFTSRGK